ncbi:MAG: hypothetical protein V3W04_11170 [Gammaproteobacteria bacterium]
MTEARSELTKLFSSSIMLVIIRVGGLVCGFLLMLLLARSMETEAVGQIITGMSVVMLLSILATLNFDAGGLRFLSEYVVREDEKKAASYMLFGFKILFTVGGLITLLSLIVYFLPVNHEKQILPPYIFYALLSIMVFGWMRLSSSYMHAKGHVIVAQIPRSFLRQAVLLSVVAALVYVKYPLDSELVMRLFYLTLIIVAIYQYTLFRSDISVAGKIIVPDNSDSKQWLEMGFYTLTPVLFLEFSIDMIILLSTTVISQADIAVMAVVMRVAGFLQFGVTAINMAVGPKIASALHKDEHDTVNHLLKISGLLKLLLVFIGLLAFYLLGEWLLSVFGEQYAAGFSALMVFACLPLVITIFGPGVLFLTVLDLKKYLNPVFIISLLLLTLSIVFIGTRQGIVGVAISTVFVWFGWNCALYLVIKKKSGYDISIFGLFKNAMLKRAAES